MKKFKFLIPLLFVAVFLFGCQNSAAITNGELHSSATSLKKDLTSQKKLLKKLKKGLTATQKIYDDLTVNSEIEELNQSLALRDATMTKLKNNQTKQEKVKTVFDATIEKNNKKFPIQKLKQVVQSQEISFLDAKTFNEYLDQTKKVEAKISDIFDQDPIDETALKSNIDLLDRYYAALFQQLEIWNVNVIHVSTTNSSLLKSLN